MESGARCIETRGVLVQYALQRYQANAAAQWIQMPICKY